jgi:hypothetical protein
MEVEEEYLIGNCSLVYNRNYLSAVESCALRHLR